MKLKFDAKDIMELIQISPMKIRLVKDDGIYVLPDKTNTKVVYAKGAKPGDATCENKMYMFGGDDECIEMNIPRALRLATAINLLKTFNIIVSPQEVKIEMAIKQLAV